MIPDSIPKVLFAAILLGIFLPISGRHLILGRSILLGLAVPQISMAGIAFLFLGSALGWGWTKHFSDDSARAAVGALLFALPTLAVLVRIQRAGRHLSEAWLAVAYLASFAATNLMLSSDAIGETYLSDLFHGRLILISDGALRLLAMTLTTAGLVALGLRRRLLLVLTDQDFAAVARVPVTQWMVLLALLDGCVIGVSVAAVGPLVTFGFLILPSLTASTFARSLRSHLVISIAAGTITAFCGYRLAYRYDLPLGDCMVAFAAGLLMAVRILQSGMRLSWPRGKAATLAAWLLVFALGTATSKAIDDRAWEMLAGINRATLAVGARTKTLDDERIAALLQAKLETTVKDCQWSVANDDLKFGPGGHDALVTLDLETTTGVVVATLNVSRVVLVEGLEQPKARRLTSVWRQQIVISRVTTETIQGASEALMTMMKNAVAKAGGKAPRRDNDAKEIN